MSIDVRRRLMSKCVHYDGGYATLCLMFCGAWTKGYGHIKVKGEMMYAHRVAWELENGPIPDGFHVLHKCDNGWCVRVDHLWLGTHAQNMRDMSNKGRGRPWGSLLLRSR